MFYLYNNFFLKDKINRSFSDIQKKDINPNMSADFEKHVKIPVLGLRTPIKTSLLPFAFLVMHATICIRKIKCRKW